MRQLALAACGVCLWLGLPGPTQAQDDECRAVIAKAMKAAGGEDKLAAARGIYLKAKGVVTVMGNDLDFTAELYGQDPDKQKSVIEANFNGMNFTITKVIDGKMGWQRINNDTVKLTDDQMKEEKESFNAERAANLVALKEKHYKLSSLGDVKVGDQQAVGILVSREGFRDVSLYFDKKTHFLVKTETRAQDPNTQQEATQEKFLGEYKELVPGMPMASKLKINFDNKKFLDATITEARVVEQHDASIFAKP
jgi:hypothetical protein